ncbi:MAG: hypothetical protein Q9220_003725 [cf. Caloplaca sp. 1 TL-2023]
MAGAQRIYEVGILLFQGADLLDFAGPHGVLSHVSYNNNPVSPEHVFNIRFIAAKEEVTASDPVTVKRHISISDAQNELENFDILIVPGGPLPIVQGVIDANGPEYQFIKSYINESKNEERILMSVCSGAFILGSTGILAGKTATTHSLALDGLKDICQEMTKKLGGSPTKVMKARYVDGGMTKSGLRDDDESMEGGLEPGDPFAIPDLWPTSNLIKEEDEAFPCTELVRFDDQPDDQLVVFTPVLNSIPTLESGDDDFLQFLKKEQNGAIPFCYGPLEEIESLDSSSSSSESENIPTFDDGDEDPWSVRGILRPMVILPSVANYEKFLDRSFERQFLLPVNAVGPRISYSELSHKDVSGFDETVDHQQAFFLRPDVILSSLVQLAFGRESVIYQYDEQLESFLPVQKDIRPPGISPKDFEHLIARVISYASQIRKTKKIAGALRGSKATSSVFVALASGIDTVLSAIETYLSEPLSNISAILDLQTFLDQPMNLVDFMSVIVEKATSTDDSIELLSILFDSVQRSELWLRPIMKELLACVSSPWLESTERQVGLGQHTASPMIYSKSAIDEQPHFDSSLPLDIEGQKEGNPGRRIPNFISKDLDGIIWETRRGWEVLQNHEPEHPIACLTSSPALDPPLLQWHNSWRDVERIEVMAHDYECNILQVLKQFHKPCTVGWAQARPNKEVPECLDQIIEAQELLLTSLTRLNGPLPTFFTSNVSPLSTAVHQVVNGAQESYDTAEIIPIDLVPPASFQPILSAQSRLVSRSVFHLLFRTHSLRSHLRLLHSSLLFADGSFLTRLSDTLFKFPLPSKGNTNEHDSPRESGLEDSVGKSWPPASSALRIALMDILTESCNASRPQSRGVEGDLPGGLGFSFHCDVTPAGQDDLEAFDFLRLQYKPPKPLDNIITDSILEQYDRLSHLLLRGARMVSVVSSMMRHQGKAKHLRDKPRIRDVLRQRFRFEALHFVTTVFNFLRDNVEETWSAFQRSLDGVENDLASYEVGKEVMGLRRFERMHEGYLEQLCEKCLLKPGQQKEAMRILESIWVVVLKFGRKTTHQGEENVADDVEDMRDLYGAFRNRVKDFLLVCKGLQELEGEAGGKGISDTGKNDGDEVYGIERLLLALEMNGWYTR